MDPKIGSPNDDSPERLAAILSHCTINPEISASDGAHEPPSTPIQTTNVNVSRTFPAAFERFSSRNGPHLLKTFIAPLFETWNMNSTFGVCLLYEAITLPPGCKVLVQHDSLKPWPQDQHQSLDDTHPINEVAWQWIEGQWKAFEYTYDRTTVGVRRLGDVSDGNGTEMQGFLDAFADLLYEHDLQDILGLRAVPDEDFMWWVELPTGEGASRFAPVESDEWDDDGTRECAWFFNGGDIWQDGTCLRYGDVPSAPYEHEESENGSVSSQLEPEVEDFHSTLRRFSNTMVVEDIEVLDNGDVRFHGRKDIAPRPSSR